MTEQIKFKYDILNGTIEFEGAHELLRPTLKSLAKMFNGGGKTPVQNQNKGGKTKPQASTKPSKSGSVNSGPKKKAVKQSYSFDKKLDLFPSNKTTFKDFALEKIPTTHMERCVLAAYYLVQTLEIDATANKIYTCFKAVSWPIPTNLKNTLSQAASKKGWLDTENFNDIKLTSTAKNLVEHELPKKPKE